MSLNPETPSSDEIAAALGDLLTAAGLPAILGSVIDHCMMLFHLESIEPGQYWQGSTIAEKTQIYTFEIAAVRSFLAYELAQLGIDQSPPDISGWSPN